MKFNKTSTEDGYDVYELLLVARNSSGALNVTCNAEPAAVAGFGECRQMELDRLHYKVLAT